MGLIFRQFLAVMPVFLLKFMMGVGVGWLAPMLHQLKTAPETAFTSEQCAWIAACHYIGRGISPVFAITSIDRMGRNFTFIIASLIAFIMWIPVYYSRVVYVHYIIRLFFGVSVGFNDAAAGIYMGENCSPQVRGIFSGIHVAFFYFGEVLIFGLAAYLSYEWVTIVSGILGFIVIVSTFLLKEPAQFLIMKGKLAKAEKNYNHLHDLQNLKTKKEFEDIKQYVSEVKRDMFSLDVFRSKEASRSIRIVLFNNFLSTGGGFVSVNSFVTIALAGTDGLSTSQLTVLFGMAQFVTASFSTAFLDTFNRRTLYLFSWAIITIIHAATAALYYLDSIYTIPYFNWSLFTLLTTFSCIIGMFVSPLTTAIQGELLPQEVKALGSSFGVVLGSLGGFLGAKIFLPISEAYGTHFNFILFSFMNLASFFYNYIDLPETKGKTLTDIQRELRGEQTKEVVKNNDTHVESIRL